MTWIKVRGHSGQGQRSYRHFSNATLSLKCVDSTCNSPYDVIKKQVGSHQRQVAFRKMYKIVKKFGAQIT